MSNVPQMDRIQDRIEAARRDLEIHPLSKLNKLRRRALNAKWKEAIWCVYDGPLITIMKFKRHTRKVFKKRFSRG